MNSHGITRFRLEPQRTTLSASTGGEVIVAAGVDGLADVSFHHDPPTPAEMEQAIDVVEEALMATHLPHAERGELVTSDPWLRGLPGLRDEGASLTRDDVEALFQQLASASLGNSGALRNLPAGGRAGAALLILRECMHHLGYESVRIRIA